MGQGDPGGQHQGAVTFSPCPVATAQRRTDRRRQIRDLTGDPGAPLTFAGSLEIAAIAVLGLFRFFQHRHGLRP